MDSLQIEIIADYQGPWREKFGIPRQAGLVENIPGQIILRKPFAHPDFIKGIEEFSHLWILWIFHDNIRQEEEPQKYKSTVRPPRLSGNTRKGVFASRSPFRPNPLGLSVVRLDKIEIGPKQICLHVLGADLLDGTPIVDIKPYIPYADSIPDANGAFANEAPERLEVVWELEDNPLDQNTINLVSETLAFKPIPAYHKDESRLYGMQFENWDISFQHRDEAIYIVSVKTYDDSASNLNVDRQVEESKTYWIYMLLCSDKSIYTGVALDPEARLAKHNAGTGAKYTKTRRPCKIIYLEQAANRSLAQKREWAIKQLTRAEKIALSKTYQKTIADQASK